jgi:hypothetical protein
MDKIIPTQYREIWRPKVGTGKRGIPYINTTIDNGIPTVKVPQEGKTVIKGDFR